MHIKKGDTVAIIAGKDKGKEGKVLVSIPSKSKVIVEGINIQKRHTKPRSAQATGGIIDKAGPIDCSNAMVICPKCKKATRIAMLIDADGRKYRACKKEGCGENLDKKAEKAEKSEKPAKKAIEGKTEKSVKKSSETKVEKTDTVKSKAEEKKPTAKKPAAKKTDKAE